MTDDQRDGEQLRIARWTKSRNRSDQAIEVIADVQLLEEEANKPPRPRQVMGLFDERREELRTYTRPPIAPIALA